MTLVIDSSLVVAALIDGGPDGTWADRLLGTDDLAAPHLMPVEVANILRRSVLSGAVSPEIAALAYGDFQDLAVELFAFEPLATRIWELRENVTAYDAWYVALAESLDATLATLDRRLANAVGPACRFALPPPPPPEPLVRQRDGHEE